MRRLNRSFIVLFLLSLVGATLLGIVVSARLLAESSAVEAVGDPNILASQKPRIQDFNAGEDATFTVSITNTGPIDLDTVSVTGATTPDCNRDDLGSLAPGESSSYTCGRDGVVTSFLNELQANGTAEGYPPATHHSDAYVKVWTPQIRIYKDDKTQLVRYGEEASFDITLFNTSDSDLKVDWVDDNLVDDCDVNPTLTVTIEPNESINYPCSLPNVQAPMTTIISFQASDPLSGESFTATDAAWVELLRLQATLTPSTTVMPEPGDIVTFTVDLVNSGSVALTPNGLTTDRFGNLLDPSNPLLEAGDNNCLSPSPLPTLAPFGGAYSCTFVAQVNGQPPAYTVNLTATGEEVGGLSISTTAAATITLENLSASMVLSLAAEPPFIGPPGRMVSFSLHIENTSAVDAITITGLVDEFLGDLDGQGTCELPVAGILPGGSYSCSFSDFVAGEVGDQVSRDITAEAISDDPTPDILSLVETVTVGITDQPGRDLYLPSVTDDTVEPNDNCTRAYPLTLDRQYFFLPPAKYDSNLPADQRDQDYFSFELAESGRVRIDLSNFLPQKGQLILRPHINGANPPCGVNSISRHFITATNHQFQVADNGLLQPGRYYIQLVNDGPSNVTTYYGLRVHVEIP